MTPAKAASKAFKAIPICKRPVGTTGAAANSAAFIRSKEGMKVAGLGLEQD